MEKKDLLGIQLLHINYEVSGLVILGVFLIFLILLIWFIFSISYKTKCITKLKEERDFALKEKALLKIEISDLQNELYVSNTDKLKKNRAIKILKQEIMYLKSINFDKILSPDFIEKIFLKNRETEIKKGVLSGEKVEDKKNKARKGGFHESNSI